MMMPNALASLASGYAPSKLAAQKRKPTPLEQAQQEGEQMAMMHAHQMGLPPPGRPMQQPVSTTMPVSQGVPMQMSTRISPEDMHRLNVQRGQAFQQNPMPPQAMQQPRQSPLQEMQRTQQPVNTGGGWMQRPTLQQRLAGTAGQQGRVIGGGEGRVRTQPVVVNPGKSFSYRRG